MCFFKKVPTGYACIHDIFFASGYTLAMLAFTVFAKTVNQAVPIATFIENKYFLKKHVAMKQCVFC